MHYDPKYMQRALELARHGMGAVSPNPMVGAVIVNPDGLIIGDGYHRRYGGPHAEVNAVASVADKSRLRDSTMYVTLEPCSHYGKTPPCAELIIKTGIPRVVVGAGDPNEKVSGRGIAMLRNAGVEVVEGVLADESRSLNARFFTAHEQRRPFVTFKWAQSADGYIDIQRTAAEPAAKISEPFGRFCVHRIRSLHDAILVGSGTVLADDPLLDARLWGGRSPRPVILDSRRRVDDRYCVMQRDPIIIDRRTPVDELLNYLFERGITSVLVEGGAQVLSSFIEAGIWDVARVETSPVIFGQNGAVKAPVFEAEPSQILKIGQNTIRIYTQNPLFDVKNL